MSNKSSGNKSRSRWVLAAAIGALPLFALASAARAQYPVNQDGHANDANNRVGSNGVNDSRGGGPAATGNQIITGNVTGGKEFRGPVGYRDPRAFTGPIGGGLTQDFVRGSAGTPTSGGGPTDLTVAHPFYGDRRAVAPPPGALPEGFNGGYVGSSLTSPYSMTFSMNTSPAAEGLQSRTVNRDTYELNAMLNPTSYSGMTPADAFDARNMASPLWGALQPANAGQNGLANYQLNQVPGGGDRFANQDTPIQAMQRELREAAGMRQPQKPGANGAQPNQAGANGQQPDNGQNPQDINPLNQPLDNPLEAPTNGPLNGQPLSSALNNNPLNSTTNTKEGIRNYLTMPPPALQSPVLGELQKRMERYTAAHPMTDADANREFQNQRRRAEELAANKNNPTPGRSPIGDTGAAPPGQTPRAIDVPPLVLHSLADGIKAKGLHDLLASAEDLMRQDKFASAIEKYNQAGRVAPNNVLPALGRAVAEMGAGYYAQADRDLHIVFRVAPELLWGQVDLKSMLSPQRLDYVRKDLTGLTQSDPKSERPWFLLAFIAYNTGDANDAQRDLNEAGSRAPKMDATIPMLKARWAPAPANKAEVKPEAPTTEPAKPAAGEEGK